jgi:hypothetical protein
VQRGEAVDIREAAVASVPYLVLRLARVEAVGAKDCAADQSDLDPARRW